LKEVAGEGPALEVEGALCLARFVERQLVHLAVQRGGLALQETDKSSWLVNLSRRKSWTSAR